MCFVANFIRFADVQKFENRLRFDKVTESIKVGTFLGQCTAYCVYSSHSTVIKPILSQWVKLKCRKRGLVSN